MRNQARIVPAFVAMTTALACSRPAVRPPVPLAFAPAPGNCSPPNCPGNAATVHDGLVFWELDAAGFEANGGGVRLTAARLVNGTPVTLRVDGHNLSAKSQSGASFSGAQLAGAIMTLVRNNGAEYELRLDQVFLKGPPTFLAGPSGVDIPTYQINFRKTKNAGGVPRDKGERFAESICLGENTESQEMKYRTLIFNGDRYTAENKVQDYPGKPHRWFNLACAGTAMWKLHLYRHTRAGNALIQNVQYVTTQSQRQTMLRLLTADYCGTAHPFTKNGQKLFYGNRDWFPTPELGFPDQRLSSVDGIWTADGAVCVGTPRLPEVELTHIKAECLAHNRPVPVDCATMPVPWYLSGYMLSGNPMPEVALQ